jgi:8-oxo-dGTP diphosphatase
MEMHKVVAGVLISRQHVLLCHRNPDRKWYPDVWDLPGGHVDALEAPPDALARELEEELGVRVPPPADLPLARFKAGGIDFIVWAIDTWDGDVTNLDPGEHDALGWFDQAALVDLNLAHPTYVAMLSKALENVGD